MSKWRVKFSTGGGPFPPYEVDIYHPKSSTEEEVLAYCNKHQREIGSYFVAVSAILVEEDKLGGK